MKMNFENITAYERGQLITTARIYCELVMANSSNLPLNLPNKYNINWAEDMVAAQLKRNIRNLIQDNEWDATYKQLFTMASMLIWAAEGYMPNRGF